jgi:hypothetical protein
VVETAGLGIERAAQPGGGYPGKAQGHGPAPPRGKRGGSAFAQYRRAKRIRHHQATILRDQRGRKPARHGETQAVGKFAIVRPFVVGAKIGDRTLDFDDNQVAALAERQNIGAAAVGEREFDEARIAEVIEGAAHAAR